MILGDSVTEGIGEIFGAVFIHAPANIGMMLAGMMQSDWIG